MWHCLVAECGLWTFGRGRLPFVADRCSILNLLLFHHCMSSLSPCSALFSLYWKNPFVSFILAVLDLVGRIFCDIGDGFESFWMPAYLALSLEYDRKHSKWCCWVLDSQSKEARSWRYFLPQFHHWWEKSTAAISVLASSIGHSSRSCIVAFQRRYIIKVIPTWTFGSASERCSTWMEVDIWVLSQPVKWAICATTWASVILASVRALWPICKYLKHGQKPHHDSMSTTFQDSPHWRN